MKTAQNTNSANVEPRIANGHSADVCIDEVATITRPSFGTIARANLPIEIYRTERPIRRFLRLFLNR